MDKLNMETPNLTDKNIEKILELFPNVATEKEDENGKLKIAVDFDKLKQELSDNIVDGEESYDFTWVGKREAMVEANRPIRKTLRPKNIKDKNGYEVESLNWETTENLYIEGDNLDALKLLQESYLNQVKMIYIDPPYNTGNDSLTYKDDFAQTKEEFEEDLGVYDENGYKMFKNKETNPRFHSSWCSNVYPLIKLARNLLTDDGVIFISIDDNEVDNLRKMCDEIFGKDNFLAQLPTIMNLKGNNDEFAFAGTHEYTLVFCKNKSLCKVYEFPIEDEGLDEWDEDDYGFYKKGANLKATGGNAPREKRPNLYFPIFINSEGNSYVTNDNQPLSQNDLSILPITDGKEMSWRWEKKKFMREPYNIIVSKSDNGSISIYKKQRPSLGDLPSKKPKTTFYKPEYSSGNGTAQIKSLFNEKVFSNPKPLDLIKDFLFIGTNNTDNHTILDFYSGSATIAQAIMEINANDDGNRKYICVQIPEELDKNNKDQQVAYDFLCKIDKPTNICEIGKERIRRAGKKIQEENPDKQIDIGFRVLKVDDTNMKDVYFTPQETNQKTLGTLVSNIKDDRTDEDLLYGVLLDWGVELSLPHKVEEIDGKRVHIVNNDDLVACFESSISETVIRKIAEKKPTRVVFRDGSFNTDDHKINVEEIFKLLAPDTTVKVI